MLNVNNVDGILSDKSKVSLESLRDNIENKLTKPSGNPAKDSVVVVDSSGNVSYKALSDLVSTQSVRGIRSVIY